MTSRRYQRLFALLGLSPGVLHTILCAWRNHLEPNAEIIVITTSRETGEEALRIARTCPCPGSNQPPLTPSHRATLATLSHQDYDSIEAIQEIRRILDERRANPRDAIDVTGGRKLAAIATALYAATQKHMTVGYTHIPTQEYKRIQSTTNTTDPCTRTTRTPPKLILPII